MMRIRIACILIVVLALCACSTSSHIALNTMTEEKRQQLIDDIMIAQTLMDPKRPGEGDCLFADRRLYYMGNYDGYDYVFYDSLQFSDWCDRIGEEFFFDNQYSNIYLIKDGEKIELRQASEDKLISDSGLFQLAKHFYQFQEAHADVPGFFVLGYGEYVFRYASQDSLDCYIAQEVPADRKQAFLYEMLCVEAKGFGLEWDHPGQNNQIFADAPYYYLGTYVDGDAVLRMESDLQHWEKAIGEESFCCFNFFSISIYRNRVCTSLQTDYESGLITDEDLFTLAKRFYQFQLENAEDPDAVRQLYSDYAARYE